MLKDGSFYLLLLNFYPKQYKRRFGREMFLAFQDLYSEELEINGGVGLGFWLSIFMDTLKSGLREHFIMIKNQGIKEYLHINSFNILGIILLAPFAALLATDFLGRLIHYNKIWSEALASSFLYTSYVGGIPLLWFVLVLAPALAVGLNLIPVILSLSKRRFSLKNLVISNPLALAILAFGLFCLLVVYGHDFFPCMVQSVISHGVVNVLNAASACRNA